MKTISENNKLTIFLEGRIDTNNAAQVEKELIEEAGKSAGAEIVIDADDLEYISSAGLRVLLSLHKIMIKQGSMKIIGVNETINDIRTDIIISNRKQQITKDQVLINNDKHYE